MRSLSLDIHGVCVRLESNEARLVDDLEDRLAYFASAATSSVPALSCSFEVVASPYELSLPRPAGSGAPVYEPLVGEMTYFRDLDELFIGLPRLRMSMRMESEEMRVVLCPEPEEMWLATHSIFAFALTESLKRHELFAVHAASVEIGGRALLLAGVNGAGKSTLSLALGRTSAQGFQGDDLVFVRNGSGGVEVLPFPDHIGVTAETAERLLGRTLEAPPPGARKHELPIAAVVPVPVSPQLEPGALVLVQPSGGDYRLERATGPESLVELAPNVLATETRASQRHLDALAALIAACPCYRLSGRGELGKAVELLTALCPG